MIKGVIIQELKIFSHPAGNVMRMLRCDESFFKQFGEIYFSFINPGCIKGWKKHLKQTQHFVVPEGQLKLVLYDDRKDSPTCGEVQEIEIGVKNYELVRIPAQVWYSFKALEDKQAMIANCTDIPHDPAESVTKQLNDTSIPYSWGQ